MGNTQWYITTANSQRYITTGNTQRYITTGIPNVTLQLVIPNITLQLVVSAFDYPTPWHWQTAVLMLPSESNTTIDQINDH